MFKSLFLLIVLVLCGCMARTSVNSMASPDNRGEQYHRILVEFPTSNLDWRKTTEQTFVERDSTFVASYALFFPGRQYTNEEIAAIDRENGIDAILVISTEATGISTETMPSQTSTACGAATDGYSTAAACATRTTGGETYRRPWANWTTKMWDLRSGAVVWMASASTGGNAFANWHTVMHSMVGSTINKLRNDHMITNGHS